MRRSGRATRPHAATGSLIAYQTRVCQSTRPHINAMVELLREAPAFVDEYLAAVLSAASLRLAVARRENLPV